MQGLLDLDGNILLWIQDHIRMSGLDGVMKFITSFGNAGIIWIIITLVLLLIPKTRKTGIVSAMALIGSLIVNNGILKLSVARIRPYEVIDGLQCIVKPAVDYSFPSGHTGSSFAAATVIFRRMPKRYGIPALVLAALIGFSRLYVGIHYPSDVLAGMVTGILLGIFADVLFQRYEKRKQEGQKSIG